MLLEDVRIWVTERKPKSSREAGELVENYVPPGSRNDDPSQRIEGRENADDEVP